MRLINYIVILSWHTVFSLFATYKILGLGKYPDSIYFNTTLLIPMFLDYQKMIGKKFDNSLLVSIKTSALMLLGDIMIDEENISKDEITKLFSNNFNAKNKSEKLAASLLEELRDLIPQRQKILLQQLNLAQIEGEETLNYEQLINVSREKGLWFPALAFSFNPQMSDAEIEALRDLGFWIKCADDYVDRIHDEKNSKQNIFASSNTESDPKETFEKIRVETFTKIKNLSYSKNKTSEFLYRMSISTYAFILHNEFLNSKPLWYKNLVEKSHIFLFLNLVLATALGTKKLSEIKAEI